MQSTLYRVHLTCADWKHCNPRGANEKVGSLSNSASGAGMQVATHQRVYVFHVRSFEGWGTGSSSKAVAPLKELLTNEHLLQYGVDIAADVSIVHQCSPGLLLTQKRYRLPHVPVSLFAAF
jgi:hypothetical protein